MSTVWTDIAEGVPAMAGTVLTDMAPILAPIIGIVLAGLVLSVVVAVWRSR